MKNLIDRLFSPKQFFILLVLLSLLVVVLMVFPDFGTLPGQSILILWVLHALSGLGLVVTTFREKISGKAKIFHLLAGFSAVGFVLGVILHNVFYALAMLAEGMEVLNAILGFLEVAFFLIAVVLCPIGLLVGVVGTIVLWKNLRSVNKEL